MKEFAGLRSRTYTYLRDKNDEDKKAKDTKMCLIKRKNLRIRSSCLKAAQIGNKINHLEKINLMQIVLMKTKKNS